jgi:transcriptional regulator with XRE-family HTH domain
MSGHTPNVPALRAALRLHRLEQRLSFEKLAREMRVSQVTAMNFIEGSTDPLDTTIYAVEQYLKAQGVEVAA